MTKKKSVSKLSRAVSGSLAARKNACVVMEVLSGMKGPLEAADSLSISMNRYYVLEARALEGLVRAMEPRARGRTATSEQKVKDLTTEVARLTRDLDRSRSVLRMTERTIGLQAPKNRNGKARRRVNRSKKVLSLLRPKEEDVQEKEKVS